VFTYSAGCDVPEETPLAVTAWLLAQPRDIGTRFGRRAGTVRAQAKLVLRWFRDDALLRQLQHVVQVRGLLGDHLDALVQIPARRRDPDAGLGGERSTTVERSRWRVPFLIVKDWPPRYRDYLRPTRPKASATPPPRTPWPPRVVINVNGHDNTWSAVWDSSAGLLGELDSGTRREAITWARARCDRVFMFSPELLDLVLLDEL